MGLKEKIDEAVTLYKVELNTDFCMGPNFIDQFGYSEPVYFTAEDAADAYYSRLVSSSGKLFKIADSLEAKLKDNSAPLDCGQKEIRSQTLIAYLSDERGGGHVVHRVVLSSCRADKDAIEEKAVVMRQYRRKQDGKVYELQ